MTPAPSRTLGPAFLAASNLFAAAIFCLFLAVSLGGKLIAAGHVLLVLALAAAFWERGRGAFALRSLGSSALALAAFVVCSVVSVLVNLELTDAPFETLGKLRYLVFALLLSGMAWVVRGPLSEAWRRNVLVWAWLVPLGLVAGVSAASWLLGHHALFGRDVADYTRVSGLFGQVMTYAYSLQFSFVLLACFFVAPHFWRGFTQVPWWVAVVFLFLCGGILYLTYTRGAMLGAATGLAALAALRSWKLRVLLLVIGLSAAAVARMEGARYFSFDADIRTGQWKAASLSFLERPVFGLGYRNFEIYSAELKERYGFEKDLIRERDKPPREDYFRGHAHNNYLEAFASTGVFGGLAFLAFCWLWLRESMRSGYRLLLVPLVVTFLVSGFFENTFFDSEVLNCILIVWLASQWLFLREKEAVEASRTGDPQPTLP